MIATINLIRSSSAVASDNNAKRYGANYLAQASRASLASAVDRQKRALDTVSAPRVADGGLGWQVAFLPGRKTTVQAHPRGWKEHASHLRKRANSLDAHA